MDISWPATQFHNQLVVEGAKNMKSRKDTGYSRRLRQALMIILCAIIVAGLSVRPITVSAQALPKIIILGQTSNSPQNDTLILNVNQTFLMTVNITDSSDLYDYQVVFKYNQTMLNMTDLTFPSDNVFAGQSVISVSLTPYNQTPSSLIDVKDGLGVGVAGQTIIGGLHGVDVSNGILFQVNFTVAVPGETVIQIADVNATAELPPPPGHVWYTFTQNSQQSYLGGENDDFDLTNATLAIISGAGAVPPPVAYFTAYGSTVSNSKYFIINMTSQGSVVTIGVLCNLTTYFDASASYDKYANIVEYIWNFGDGNTTVVQATGSNTDALITHVFTGVGIFLVNLTVVAQSGPNVNESDSYTYPITVNFAVAYYNWSPFIYTVLGIILAAVAVSVARSSVRRGRRRRLRQQKVRMPNAPEQPPTGTATT